jgi:hypothetical protein
MMFAIETMLNQAEQEKQKKNLYSTSSARFSTLPGALQKLNVAFHVRLTVTASYKCATA